MFFKERRGSVNPCSLVNPDQNVEAKLVRLVLDSREKLRPWLELKSFISRVSYMSKRLGDVDGAGILIRLSSVRLSAGNSVEGAEFLRFMDQTSNLVQAVQTSLTNTAVTSALMLTISFPIFFESISAPFEDFEDPTDPTVWGEASLWLGGGEIDAALRLKRGFHAAELTLLSLGIITNIVGVSLSVAVIAMLTPLPNELNMLSFLYENVYIFGFVQNSWGLGLLFIMMFMPFAAARVSGVAFLCACGVFLISIVGTNLVLWPMSRSQASLSQTPTLQGTSRVFFRCHY